jgi:amino acid adenylation domain-containing protein/thioester reductase-like protein
LLTETSKRISALSPEKRKLFAWLLRREGIDPARLPIIALSRESNSFPLSFGQERLWFLDQLEPGNPVYNESGAVRLRGRVDVNALERALNEIVGRHEILRTTFVAEDGRPVQVVAPSLTVPLPVVKLGGFPPAECEARARQLAAEYARLPFDLAQGPLLRAVLLRLDEQDHVIIMTMHHIICDAWSIGVLIREMAVVYEAFSAGNASPLSDLPIQYADFAHWQRQWLQDEVLETQLAYWSKQLAGHLPVLQLPTVGPRPAIQSYRGATHTFVLPPTLTERLKELGRREGVTLFMTLLGAFQTLLYRYTAQEDIIVGSPIAGRNRPEIEGLIGFFVNLLPLRTNLSGRPSFRELLQRVRDVALGAVAHQDIPFEKLVEKLQLERSLSHAPVFQVGFALQNVPLPALEYPGLRLTPFEFESGTAKLDLTLQLSEGPAGLSGRVDYSTELFDAATIARMTEHFQTLLEGIVANPSQRLSALPLLTETERHQVLVEWNNTQADYPKDSCVHELFEAQVARTPDAVALVFEDEQLTYRELNARANQVAHGLQRLGVGPEVRVGICLERSPEMIVGLLGVLKAGGAYVPLDPAYPRQRLSFMVEDAQVSVLLTQYRLLTGLQLSNLIPSLNILCLDADWPVIAEESDASPLSLVTVAGLAYVIYTSGSTGTPKGVMIEHRGIGNLALAQIRAFDVRPDSRVLQFSSLCFDASVSEIFMALLAGGTLCVVSRESVLPGPDLIRLLREQAITTVTLPPSVLAALPVEELPALRTIIVAGESCSAELVARWGRGRRMFNGYGPTEATVCAAIGECIENGRTPPIGRPIANTRIYLLDSSLQPVPIGVPGELYIGGIGLARGYLNRPELTAEKFVGLRIADRGLRIEEPEIRKAKPEILYRTGDLARYLPDGNIEFLGRTDHQVKLRGFRIELGEIEAVLRQHPGIREAIVLLRDDSTIDECGSPTANGAMNNPQSAIRHPPSERRLVAYVVPDHGEVPTVSELRSFLKEKLPDYMTPSGFVLLDDVPLTSNGKSDRQALPTLRRGKPMPERNSTAPRTSLETKLTELWADVLHCERVGIHDNFFELGGHSLLAAQLVFRLRDTFQMELPLRCLFEHPTIAGLAQALDEMLCANAPPAAIVIDLHAEASLDPTIRPESASLEPVTDPAHIFLTGATGFLGAFLLRELLDQTRADIYCLVRSPNEREGRRKITGRLEAYELWSYDWGHRIIPVPGDLSLARLGLSTEQFQTMAEKIDVIYHCGAAVNFLQPYQALRPANVVGTQEVLRLASQIKLKPVHYVSTLSVFPFGDNSEILSENDRPVSGERLDGGYAQSKWVAERLVMMAQSRGLPVCIYRPGRVSGHSRTGVANTDDVVCQIIKALIQLECAPDLDVWVDLTPVDYVSRAIIHLSRQPESLGKAFHLINPRPLQFDRLVSGIRALGYPLRPVSLDHWRAAVAGSAHSSSEAALSPLWPLLSEKTTEAYLNAGSRRFDCRNTLDGLVGAQVICPPVDAELLGLYFSYFVQSGFLPPPSGGERRRDLKMRVEGAAAET